MSRKTGARLSRGDKTAAKIPRARSSQAVGGVLRVPSGANRSALIRAFCVAKCPLARPKCACGAKFFHRGESFAVGTNAHAKLRADRARGAQERNIAARCDVAEPRISSAFLERAVFCARDRGVAEFFRCACRRELRARVPQSAGARHLHTKLSEVTVIFFSL